MKLPTRVPLPTPNPMRAPWGGQGTNYFPPAPAAPMGGGMMGGARNWIGDNSEALAAMSQALLSGRTAGEQFGGAFGAFAQAKAGKKKKNATLEWLRAQDPATAEAVDLGIIDAGTAWTAIQKAKQPQNTEFSQRAAAAQQYGIDPASPEGRAFILTGKLPGADGGVTFGKTPVYGTDPETGESILGVVGDDGSFKRLDTGNFAPSTGIDKIDAGTHYNLYDKRSGQMIGTVPKDNYGEAFDKAAGDAQGEARGKAMAGIAGARSSANKISAMIEDLKNDPALPNVLGPIDSRTPVVREESARVQSKIDQLRGWAFLEAREMLKGGGAITDFESTRAEQAFIRLNQAQNEGDFKAALDDFNAAVQSGVMKLEMQAGGAPSVQSGPVSGRTSSGLTFTVE